MTYGEVLPIWWSCLWRAALGGIVAGSIAGFFAGIVAGIVGQPEAAGVWGGIAGWVVSIPVSLWAMRAAINKHDLRAANSSTG